jgi:heat shock protein HslJ
VVTVRTLLALTLLLPILVLAGCTGSEPPAEEGTPPAATEPAVTLEDTSWKAVNFAVGGSPQPVLADAPITAEFGADGTLSGSAGVNTYTTSYETDGGNITIGEEIATTMMAGSEEAMTQESNYLTTLPTAQTFEIDKDSGQLVLFGPAQNTIARYDPTE